RRGCCLHWRSDGTRGPTRRSGRQGSSGWLKHEGPPMAAPATGEWTRAEYANGSRPAQELARQPSERGATPLGAPWHLQEAPGTAGLLALLGTVPHAVHAHQVSATHDRVSSRAIACSSTLRASCAETALHRRGG